MKIPDIISELKALFYPELCNACNTPLAGSEAFICLDCELHLPRTGFDPGGENALRKIFYGRMQLDQAHAWLFFRRDGRARQLMHSLKYSGDGSLAFYLGRRYAMELLREKGFVKPDFLISVPMHKDKLLKRGFNQSEQIARGFSEVSGIPYLEGVLERVNQTVSQTRKKRYERWENSERSFRPGPAAAAGLSGHAALIDDVLTTGATAESCLSVLASSGLSRFSVYTLCAAVN